MRPGAWVLVGAGLLWSGAGLAQPGERELATRLREFPDLKAAYDICQRVRTREPPQSDWPSPKEEAALKGCDSEALFYGIGQRADPVKARKCALLEWRRARHDVDAFTGSEILMSIYATGHGARRDLDLATRMACDNDSAAPVDVDTLVRNIQARKTDRSLPPLNYCTDVEQGRSNVSIPACAAHDFRVREPGRQAAFAAIRRSLPARARPAFDELRRREATFGEARGFGERRDAADYRADATRFPEAVLEADLALLKLLSRGRGPKASRTDRAAAERRLQEVFQSFDREYRADFNFRFHPDGLREAQAEWTRYRDAWLALVRTAWPGASLDGVSKRLADDRTLTLRCVRLGNDEDEELNKLCG
jgi:hypothetical protein